MQQQFALNNSKRGCLTKSLLPHEGIAKGKGRGDCPLKRPNVTELLVGNLLQTNKELVAHSDFFYPQPEKSFPMKNDFESC